MYRQIHIGDVRCPRPTPGWNGLPTARWECDLWWQTDGFRMPCGRLGRQPLINVAKMTSASAWPHYGLWRSADDRHPENHAPFTSPVAHIELNTVYGLVLPENEILTNG